MFFFQNNFTKLHPNLKMFICDLKNSAYCFLLIFFQCEIVFFKLPAESWYCICDRLCNWVAEHFFSDQVEPFLWKLWTSRSKDLQKCPFLCVCVCVDACVCVCVCVCQFCFCQPLIASWYTKVIVRVLPNFAHKFKWNVGTSRNNRHFQFIY